MLFSKHNDVLGEAAVNDNTPHQFSIHDNEYDNKLEVHDHVAMASNLKSTCEQDPSISCDTSGVASNEDCPPAAVLPATSCVHQR